MSENLEINKNKQKQETTHKIGIYLWIWGLLFVLSFFSYMVDWYQFQGLLRWSLILFFYVPESRFNYGFLHAPFLGTIHSCECFVMANDSNSMFCWIDGC